MTPDTLRAWLTERDWTNRRAATELGVHPNTIGNWLSGTTPIPRYIALACGALTKGLPPYDTPT